MTITEVFQFVSPEKVDIIATLNWSKPYAYEVLLSGNADEDDQAYFYAVVAYSDGEWWTYYFGMVYDQWVSDRQKARDHVVKLEELKKQYVDVNFQLSLATLSIQSKTRITKSLIREVEGLLIFSNWHEALRNRRKVSRFSSKRSFYIMNAGFIEHLDVTELGYGVFWRNT